MPLEMSKHWGGSELMYIYDLSIHTLGERPKGASLYYVYIMTHQGYIHNIYII